MWAIIGGSGFEKFDGFKPVENLNRSTPFGDASSGIKEVEVAGTKCLFVPRHGENHELLPSEVNYQANIFALKQYGATKVLSVSAVGSLAKEFKPGDMVVPTQYIDRTKSLRKVTFCGDGVVGHVSLAKPVSSKIVSALKEVAGGFQFDCHFDKTYVCIEGPYFSTKAESNTYRQMGADIIGMTNFPEFALAREAGLSYLPCSFVTDYDCWDDSIPHVTVEEVLQVMRQNNSKAFELAEKIIPLGWDADSADINGGLKTSLMTPMEVIPPEKREWLAVLRGE